MAPWIHVALAAVLAPLLPGLIARTKAFFAGRCGPPLAQTYHDLVKLLRKGAVYSRTAGWIFRAGPVVGLVALAAAALLVPFGGRPAPLAFDGDLVLFAGLLALARCATVAAALDTGSSFEGMGASREVQFAALAEPPLLLGLAALARQTGALSLSSIVSTLSAPPAAEAVPVLALVFVALAVVFLAENSRIPFDDPNTHLELTMIHEVMVLDHGGPDLAFILYAAALKLWVLGALLVGILVPSRWGGPWGALAGMAALSIGVGAIESSIARLRLVKIPRLLVGATALAALALMLGLR
jgi:formate hydrogenlyase subunit 4